LLEAGGRLQYAGRPPSAGVYGFPLEGRAEGHGHALRRRAAAVTATDRIQLTALQTSRRPVLAVPLA